jgi:hypothetical protein
MKPSTRLALIALIIVGSSLYALLVVRDPGLASAVATGYVAVFLSLFAIINLWKSP